MNTLPESIVKQMLIDNFKYEDGFLFRKQQHGRHKIGTRALKRIGKYAAVQINGKTILYHRAVWLMFNERIPEFIDHINGDPLDNRIENLRACSKQQNGFNRKKDSRALTSPYKGVHWKTAEGKFYSAIAIGKRNVIHLGTFKDQKEAANSYDIAALLIAKEFSKSNFPREIYLNMDGSLKEKWFDFVESVPALKKALAEYAKETEG